MGIPTNFVDDWWLDKDIPKTNLNEVRNGETGVLIGYRETNIFTVQLVRNVYRVTQFLSERGHTRSSFNVRTGPDSQVVVAYTGKRFYCVEHARSLSKPETGLYEERQTWVHRSDGSLIPATGLTT